MALLNALTVRRAITAGPRVGKARSGMPTARSIPLNLLADCGSASSLNSCRITSRWADAHGAAQHATLTACKPDASHIDADLD